MLKYVKKQISELLQTLITAEEEILAVIRQGDEAGLMNVLADAQEAAVAIGGKIEESEAGGIADSAAETIGLLERYCELLWSITQTQAAEARLDLAGAAWGLLNGVKKGLEQIPEQMAVVFMPYKASMWDCMESVWMAAREDPDCVPFVMPIPYYDLKDGEVMARHYEGNKFPDYVPVVQYSKFPLEELHPDAIFVHNPFDGENVVTTVPPDYYSSDLKKVTDRLVYIPYFITGNGVFMTHRYFSSYDNMDFIVVQCEKTIDSFASELPREKFLPYGSPIVDRILRLERDKPAIPEEWKSQLKNRQDFGGNRVVMLNTSISMLLKERDRFLDKIEYLFELAKNKEGITLVWRPHPGLYSAAQAIGDEYVARLEKLEEKFLGEKIGVLDKNPDVGVAVALCDAYLGETASAVINMFVIAGKPRFYIGLQIPGNPSRKDSQKDAGEDFLASAWCQTEAKEYYVLDKPGWIVEKDKATGKFSTVVRIPGRDAVWGRAYRSMEIREGCIWVYPENAGGVFSYRMDDGRMQKIFSPRETDDARETGDAGETAETAGVGADIETVGNEGLPEKEILVEVDEECMAVIRAERFQRGNLAHEWYEGDRSSAEDFFLFLQTAEESELAGYSGGYPSWLTSLAGDCGSRVLQAVRMSLAGIGS